MQGKRRLTKFFLIGQISAAISNLTVSDTFFDYDDDQAFQISGDQAGRTSLEH